MKINNAKTAYTFPEKLVGGKIEHNGKIRNLIYCGAKQTPKQIISINKNIS